ncbi:MAG: two-component system, NarL family, sensor histidine kinase UhpB [Solirubrobacteraceae bacterium]|jgi:PAS domain S-box-containing protein|nr:two-component system, NarL family, sensor histidine kinase UhpB [Solirubrobacteraceae bacterium]
MADARTDDDCTRIQRLFAWTELIGQTGSWEFVPSEPEVSWSDNLYRIFGVEPEEVELTIESVLAPVHPDDLPRVVDAIANVVERGSPSSVEYRITRPDGDRRHLRATVAVVERRDGAPSRIAGVVQDLTDRRRAEREIAAHVAVEEALVAWEALEPGAQGLLARLSAALDCVVGVFWVPRGDVLVARVVWHESGIEAPLEAAMPARPLRRASGLPGRAWEARTPLGWSAGEPEGADPRDAASRREGLRGAVAVPALLDGEVLAIVELATDRELRIGDRLMRSLYGIAHELGHFLARRGGELSGPTLTPREVEVLQLAAQGLSAPETAERLTVSAGTVRTHLENLYRKLEVFDKPSAVATAMRLGLIE